MDAHIFDYLLHACQVVLVTFALKLSVAFLRVVPSSPNPVTLETAVTVNVCGYSCLQNSVQENLCVVEESEKVRNQTEKEMPQQ